MDTDMTNNITALVESLREHGWQGAPVIVDGDFSDIIDGNHRYEAAKALGWSDDEIPSADIRELFAAARMDFDAIVADTDYATGDMNARTEAQMMALEQLPSEIADDYNLFGGN